MSGLDFDLPNGNRQGCLPMVSAWQSPGDLGCGRLSSATRDHRNRRRGGGKASAGTQTIGGRRERRCHEEAARRCTIDVERFGAHGHTGQTTPATPAFGPLVDKTNGSSSDCVGNLGPRCCGRRWRRSVDVASTEEQSGEYGTRGAW